MALYELRTYTLQVGKMGEGAKLYQEFGMPVLKKGSYDEQLVVWCQLNCAPQPFEPVAVTGFLLGGDQLSSNLDNAAARHVDQTAHVIGPLAEVLDHHKVE